MKKDTLQSLEHALDLLFRDYGNGYGGPMEKCITGIQEAVDPDFQAARWLEENITNLTVVDGVQYKIIGLQNNDMVILDRSEGRILVPRSHFDS